MEKGSYNDSLFKQAVNSVDLRARLNLNDDVKNKNTFDHSGASSKKYQGPSQFDLLNFNGE